MNIQTNKNHRIKNFDSYIFLAKKGSVLINEEKTESKQIIDSFFAKTIWSKSTQICKYFFFIDFCTELCLVYVSGSIIMRFHVIIRYCYVKKS